jgi:hypothetical protein
MAGRKAAIQMSLGFIVAIVFAVILLSLSLSWITNIFPTIEDITHKVTDTARDELLRRMSTSGEKVGLAAPAVTEWRRGETGSYAVGIKNQDANSQLKAYINVYLSQLGGDLAGASVSSYASGVDSWLTYARASDGDFEVVDPSGQKTTDLIIRPDTSAATGIYRFTVVVCTSTPCTDLNSGGLYGYENFAIEIKA